MSADHTPRHGSSSRINFVRAIAVEMRAKFAKLAAEDGRPSMVVQRALELGAECGHLAAKIDGWPAKLPSDEERNATTNRVIVMERLHGELSTKR